MILHENKNCKKVYKKLFCQNLNHKNLKAKVETKIIKSNEPVWSKVDLIAIFLNLCVFAERGYLHFNVKIKGNKHLKMQKRD